MTDSIVVTGGVGFIGCNFIRTALAKTKARIIVVDALTYAGNLLSLNDVSQDSRYTFIEGDIADRTLMESVFRDHQPRALLNFAAQTHVDRSIDDPDVFVHTNVTGTFVLLDTARIYLRERSSAEQDAFRFLHVSTDEVYGSLGSKGSFSEETAYAPNSPYAATKAAADHLVQAYWHTYQLPTLITNCSNNYGPYQFPEKLIPLMILNAIEGKALPIYGDGKNIRDWLYVEDHCEGILKVLQEGRPGEKYNIGGNTERTNLQIIDSLCSTLERLRPANDNPALRSRGVKQYSDLKTFVEDRPGHDRRYAIDSRKILDELGWKPASAFDSGIEKTVKWYLDNEDWVKAVQSDNFQRQRLGLGSSPK